ncbi:MAG: glycosyltransferase family 4 protein [Lentisphaeria bacterium]|nr:glycosyltransferase family 4 protein [Lentisphaeria bacterium]
MANHPQVPVPSTPLRILCLYSDWRWTGPAEPVLQMCRGLRDLGHEVLFACRAVPRDVRHAEENVPEKAAGYGLRVTTEFALDRYMGVRATLHDLVALPRHLRRHRVQVLHTHLSHDHALGALCARFPGRKRPLLVQTLHRRSVPRDSLGYRLTLRGALRSDGLFVFSERFRHEYIDRFRIDPHRIALQPMTVDLERFSPERPRKPMRPEFGIPDDAVVIGIVSRFQKYRRMDTFVEAAAQVIRERPQTYFLLLGWSGQIEETVVAPIRTFGVEKNVIVAGYRTDDYEDTLACMDIFSLIMPGYDGTARAVREAMAMGKPCVVSDIGMLPDIVEHGRTGLVTPLTPEGLAQAWLRLVDNAVERQTLGRAALDHARAAFRLDAAAQTVEYHYRTWLGGAASAREAAGAPSPGGRSSC